MLSENELVAASICEPEYVSLNEYCKNAEGLPRLLFSTILEHQDLLIIYSDCCSILSPANIKAINSKNKHSDITFYFVGDVVLCKEVETEYKPPN